MTEHEQQSIEVDTVVITHDDGYEEEMEIFMEFEVAQTGHKYMVLYPLVLDDAEQEDDDLFYIFRCEEDEDGDELKLIEIEDPQEMKIVEDTYFTLVEQMNGESSK